MKGRIRQRGPTVGGPVTTSNNEAVAGHVNQARDFLAKSTDNVRLYGIHMGIWDGSKVVSPLGGIYSDLGSSATWNSCASPYTC